MSEVNKEFMLNNIEEIKAFCEGKDVEYLLHIKTNENFIMWHTLNEMSLFNIISTKLYPNCKLRIKRKKEYIYVNTWLDSCGKKHTHKRSTSGSAISGISDGIDYLSIAVKTEVDDE